MMTKRIHYLGLAWGLVAGCTPSLEKRMQQPALYHGTRTPVPLGFYFKGTYDSAEVFQNQGIYYTRAFKSLHSKQNADTLVNPQKMQGSTYIYVRSPAASPAQQGEDLRFSYGRFVDGRKDGPWLYVKFEKRILMDSIPRNMPSVDSTVVEEYRRGKLLRRKRGAPYEGSS